jgi:hypothetical protein
LRACETHDRSDPKIDPTVKIKPAMHKTAAADAARAVTVKAARKESHRQIVDNFAGMDPSTSARFQTPAPEAISDRSAPALEPRAEVKHQFGAARKASMAAIEVADDPTTALRATETHDRSEPKIDPSVTLKRAMHKASATDAAITATVKAAKAASHAEIFFSPSARALATPAAEDVRDRSAPALEPDAVVTHAFGAARLASMHKIEADGDHSADTLRATESHDRSEPRIDPSVTLKPAMHKKAATDAATTATVKMAKAGSHAQIEDNFTGMDPSTSAKFQTPAAEEINDRSAPALENKVPVTHAFGVARKESMKTLATSSASLRATETVDKSAPVIDPTVTLSTHDMRAAVKEAATTATVKMAKAASHAQIEDNFTGMDPNASAKFQTPAVEEVNDRSAPALETETPVTHAFGAARKESMKTLATSSASLRATETVDKSAPVIDPTVTLSTHSMRAAIEEAASQAQARSLSLPSVAA